MNCPVLIDELEYFGIRAYWAANPKNNDDRSQKEIRWSPRRALHNPSCYRLWHPSLLLYFFPILQEFFYSLFGQRMAYKLLNDLVRDSCNIRA